jgi:2,3-bisphosphoglycerate-dependent phosphoglycerate mutase
MDITRIIAVRHGETAWNVDTRIQGQLDVPLNERGRWQAQRAAAALAQEDIAAIYSSDLSRAFETAQHIGTPHQIRPQTHQGLRERGFGEFEGQTYAEIETRWPDGAMAWRKRVPDFAPLGGESLLQFQARVKSAVGELAHLHPGQQVVWVAHGGVLDMLYRMATGQDIRNPRTWQLGNAAINRLLWNGEHLSLVGWADDAHLQDDSLDEQHA